MGAWITSEREIQGPVPSLYHSLPLTLPLPSCLPSFLPLPAKRHNKNTVNPHVDEVNSQTNKVDKPNKQPQTCSKTTKYVEGESKLTGRKTSNRRVTNMSILQTTSLEGKGTTRHLSPEEIPTKHTRVHLYFQIYL